MSKVYFFIDFENVGSEGLRGAQYLLREDVVLIFYSHACEQIGQGCLHQIMESFCRLDICKLKKTGTNALDFYIATKTGQVFGSGYQGKAAIVSRDQGFTAVRDYWNSREKPSRQVILGANLEQCILSANENRSRTAQIREQLKPVKLETEFAKYEERMKIRAVLEEAFADTVYEENLGRIQELYERQSDRKILYLDSVKTFGKKDGLEIYRKMKELAC